MRIKLLLCALLACVTINAQTNELRELGTITRTNGITWTYPGEAVGFKIYVTETNNIPRLKTDTNFFLWRNVGTVSNRFWMGNQTAGLNGPMLLAVSTLAEITLTNIANHQPTNFIDESDFSEIVIVNFDAGRILPPRNFQLYSVLQIVATNALPTIK